MGNFRVEATGLNDEVIDVIDLTDETRAEEVIRVSKILRAKHAAGLSDFLDSGTVKVRLVDFDQSSVSREDQTGAEQIIASRVNRAAELAIREMQADIVFSSNPAAV